MKRVIAALLLFATMNVAAEVRSFGPLRPISVDRSGLLATNLGEIFGDWRSEAGRDGTVLFLWRDDRHHSPYDGAVHRQGTMAIRLGADGTPLDEFPLFLPFNPAYPVWRGSEWVVVGSGATARVSAEGALLELRAQPELDDVYGIAWTGSVFIALTRDYTTSSASLTMLDRNLDVFSVDALPDTYLDDDGTNVVMHWMRMPDFISPSPWRTQLARSFALDAGRLISIFTITRTESPYDGVQRIFVSTVDTPRARAVRH